MDVVILFVGLLYAGLGLTVGLRGRHTGQPALRRLAPFLLNVAVIATCAPLFEAGLPRLGALALLGGFAAYPVLLLRFGAVLVGHNARLERAAWVLLLLELAFAAGGAVTNPALVALGADLGAFAVAAVGAHVAVQLVMRHQVQLLPSSFVRRRASSLRAGFALLALSILGVAAQAAGGALPTEPVVAAAGTAGVLLVAGVSPPRWLQAAFVLPDVEALQLAERELFTDDDHALAVTRYLQAITAVFGGTTAWVERNGVRVAHVGDGLLPLRLGGADDLPVGAHQVTTGDGEVVWALAGRSDGVHLTVVVGRDPAMYGLQVQDLVPRLAAQLDVALRAHELEEQRRAMLAAEKESEHFRAVLALKDDLLSTINHELRTPLLVVTGGLDLVDERWELLTEEQRRDFVERIRVNAHHLAGVVAQALQLAALRSGQVHVRPTLVSVAGLAAQAREVLDRDAIAHIERLAVDVPDALVHLDARLVVDVVAELLDNALRHTAGPVLLRMHATGQHLELQVRDEGDGLDAELLDTFSRGGDYLHRETRGLGLGWSLITETVGLLGGTVAVEPGPARGTIVTCRVPLAPGAPGQGSRVAVLAPSVAGGVAGTVDVAG